MWKLVIVGFIVATVSAAPHESTISEKSNSNITNIQSFLQRPSPINPDIPCDPKPPERIILDDTDSERDQRSLNDNDKLPAHGHDSHEERGNESDDNKRQQNKEDEHSQVEHQNDKSNDHHDHRRDTETDVKNSDLKPKELVQPKDLLAPTTSGEPTIIYAEKPDEKRSAADGFQTSHRIPDVGESERKFETSHHIPTHIEDERTKVVENAKVGQKPSTL